ncbi:MAG: LysR family transcriptional regulator [Veillonellales bacterium]
MELKQLECFLAVSKLKSFTRAAEQIYMSQPNVTTTIRRLENEVGIILFERNKKKAVLTPEGKIFHDYIAIVMDDVSKATEKAAELKNLNSGIINFGISPITSLPVTSFLLAKFHTIYPSLKINFIEDGSHNIKKMLEEDHIDLGLILIDDDMDTLDYVNLCHHQLAVFLPPCHPLKNRTVVPLSALKNELLIMPKENCSLHHFLKSELTKQNIAPHVSFETNYIQMVKHLITSGAGVAILPNGIFETQTINSVLLSPSLEISIGAAKKKSKYLSYASQTLYTFLENSFT